MSIIKKLGQNPQLSMKRFLQGLGLFVVSLIFIYIGYKSNPLWQVPGLVLMAIAIIFAIWGYIEIFAHRLDKILNRQR